MNNLAEVISKEKKNKLNQRTIGLLILLFLVIVVITIVLLRSGNKSLDLVNVYGVVGGGKENVLADEEIIKIFEEKYGLNVINQTWSNGRTIIDPLYRKDLSGDNVYVDFAFFSDQRFYDYFKTAADPSKGEAPRETVQKGGLTLNTPIVIYSWDIVVDALMKENIVTEKDGVYYITDMNKLLNYILEGKNWSDIGLDLYGKVNIGSTDPVTSSPGATYYGLLLSIMCGGEINETNIEENLPKLKEFYDKSGYMGNTPADLFDKYLKTGVGSQPMIVDYEKSIIDFANSNPDGYAQVKDKIRILYPVPTIWNSHCIASFNQLGDRYYDAFNDPEVQQISWSKYGFRTGVTGGSYDVSKVSVSGIPQSIDSTVSGLRINLYNRLIEYLKEN